MRRSTFNLLIDLLSLAVFFLLALTGLMIYYVLRPCESCGTGTCAIETAQTLWGLGRHDFGRVHFYLALATVFLISLHLCLHWSWLCTTCCSLLGLKPSSQDKANSYGAIFLLLLIAFTIALLYWAKTQVQ